MSSDTYIHTNTKLKLKKKTNGDGFNEIDFTGGETILSSVVEKFKTKVLQGNGTIISGYGTTEGPMLTFLDGGAYDGSFPCGLCGHVNPGAEIKVSFSLNVGLGLNAHYVRQRIRVYCIGLQNGKDRRRG